LLSVAESEDIRNTCVVVLGDLAVERCESTSDIVLLDPAVGCQFSDYGCFRVVESRCRIIKLPSDNSIDDGLNASILNTISAI
jgi:hypothetical protein